MVSKAWYQSLGADINVTNLWGDLKFTMVGVNAVRILPIKYVSRRQVLFVEIDWRGFWTKFLVNGLAKSESKGFMGFTAAFLIIEVAKC